MVALDISIYCVCLYLWLTSASNAKIQDPLISEKVNDDDDDDDGEEEEGGNKFNDDDDDDEDVGKLSIGEV